MRPSRFNSLSSFAIASTDVLLDAEQLGWFFNLGTAKEGSARAAINMRISRGHPMPPSISIPGMSGRRWLQSSVIEWLKTHETSGANAVAELKQPATATAPSVSVARRRRGRPTKADEIARRAAHPPSRF
jgi:predicted DNA-binding transcriptional regulator AlpA